jgi:hypothetical protein
LIAQRPERELTRNSRRRCKKPNYTRRNQRCLRNCLWKIQAQIKSFSGVYSKEIKDDKSFEKTKQIADIFAKQEGRRPRIMIAKMGQDGHDRGAKVVATDMPM